MRHRGTVVWPAASLNLRGDSPHVRPQVEKQFFPRRAYLRPPFDTLPVYANKPVIVSLMPAIA